MLKLSFRLLLVCAKEFAYTFCWLIIFDLFCEFKISIKFNIEGNLYKIFENCLLFLAHFDVKCAQNSSKKQRIVCKCV
jgi:hypothetical protein